MSNETNTPFAGSSPAKRTIFPQQSDGFGELDTDSAQKADTVESRKVKFPKVVQHRKQEARIYRKSKGYPFYRVAYKVNGQRRMKSFAAYSDAKKEAERVVRELATGSQAAFLTARQARDALAGLELLEGLFRATGRRVSLLAGISAYCDSSGKLNGRTLGEAVDGYLNTVASVRRKDVAEAVNEFIAAEEPRTQARDGQRAQLSPKYHYNRAIMLRRFAATFPNTAVCDLAKEHLDTFIASLGELKSKRKRPAATSAKSRNHHRAAIRQFLQWAVRKDYLTPVNRLGEADGLRPEHANNGLTLFYTPDEFRQLLGTAEGSMQAIVAIGGLAGLRTAELLRLNWEDVWRVPGYIEVTAQKSKTRQRRLVEVCPALAAWLEKFRQFKAGKLCTLHEIIWQQNFLKLCEKAGLTRKANGLRHAFCTFHFALNGNENHTAAQAGNSPAMIHAHYKGLATKADAEKWFAVSQLNKANNVIPLAISA